MKGKFTLFELLITDNDKSNLSKKLVIRSYNSTSFSFNFEEYSHRNDIPYHLLKKEVVSAFYFENTIVVSVIER